MSIYEHGCQIIQKLKEKGHIAYFAGGWVRDFLMKVPSDDIDIATNATVEEVQALFPKTIPVGVNFGIVIVVEGDHQFEVATFRRDIGYRDGRRPTGVELADPEEDASRRDFTINGLFYDPLEEKLYDYVGGQVDIRAGIIRAIGNPHERFLEDRLRMIRAVRYASRFHFPIENHTMEAIRAHASQLFPAVAIERVWQELIKMDKFAHFDICLQTLHNLHLLPTIFPDLDDLPIEEIQTRLRFLPDFPKDSPLILKILELFPGYDLEEKQSLCQYLKLSNEERDFVTFYESLRALLKSSPDDYALAKFYADTRSSLALEIHAVKLPDTKKAEFLTFHTKKRKDLSKSITRIQENSPVLTSAHLLDAGIKPGKQMGKLLFEAERLSINERITSPKKLLAKLQENHHWRP